MIVLALLAAAVPPAQTPKAFLQQLYAQYRDPNFSPFTHPDRIFAPKLLTAIKQDSKLAHGEVGYLDGDPICQCQDPSGMRPTIDKVTRQGPIRRLSKFRSLGPTTSRCLPALALSESIQAGGLRTPRRRTSRAFLLR